MHQQLQQLLLGARDDLDDLVDHLAGQVLEVLRHHDVVERVLLEAGHLDRALGKRLELVGRRIGRQQRAPLLHQRGAFRLGHVDQGQHPVGRLLGHRADIGQPLACVGDFLGDLVQNGVVAERLQGVMELSDDAADLLAGFVGHQVLAHSESTPRVHVGGIA